MYAHVGRADFLEYIFEAASQIVRRKTSRHTHRRTHTYGGFHYKTSFFSSSNVCCFFPFISFTLIFTQMN